MRNTLRPLVAEFVGTFFLCFPGMASIVIEAYRPGSFGLLGIAAAHGIGLAIGVSATMGVSGGHLNPAITLGLLSIGKIDGRRAGLYIVAQLLSAVVAALAVKGLLPTMAGVNAQFGAPKLGTDTMMAQGIALEALCTFLLAFAVAGTCVDPRGPKLGGFAIGLTVFIGILAVGPLTGAAFNPARAFGPALVSMSWVSHAAYWIGPVIGAVTGFQVYERLIMEKAAA